MYNEIDPYAVQYLRNLRDENLIHPGGVDDRSIEEIHPEDVRYLTQFHAFAGIGVWSYALRLAGWPDDEPVWTGSCPCQPFSVAGKRQGNEDERHLFPIWRNLIAECRPPIIFGEQVASPDGRRWLSAVRTEMEALGYVFGAADLCAAGVGAPHHRQRLFFGAVRMEDADGERPQRVRLLRRFPAEEARPTTPAGSPVRMGNANTQRSGWDAGAVLTAQEERPIEGLSAWRVPHCPELAGTVRGFWDGADWLLRREPDGPLKLSPVEPGAFPLAHGTPTRVGRLRTYGNAIVPQVAATFIRAFVQSLEP